MRIIINTDRFWAKRSSKNMLPPLRKPLIKVDKFEGMRDQVHHIKSITQYHQLLGRPMPDHPHFSVIEMDSVNPPELNGSISLYYDFYAIFLKSDPEGKFRYRYGQKIVENDFETSKLFFMAPGQILGIESNNPEAAPISGWMLLIHPDYLWKTRLAKSITQYEFFHYSMNESLYLAPQEEKKVIAIIKNIQEEYH